MTNTRLGTVTTWGEFGTQEPQIKGGESDRKDDGEDHCTTANTTGPGTPWGLLGTQETGWGRGSDKNKNVEYEGKEYLKKLPKQGQRPHGGT